MHTRKQMTNKKLGSGQKDERLENGRETCGHVDGGDTENSDE